VFGCAGGAMLATGRVLHEVVSSSRIDLVHNTVSALGDGVVIATDNTRVADNDIGTVTTEVLAAPRFRPLPAKARGDAGSGIVVARNPADAAVDRCLILANRVTGVARNGIAVRGHLASAIIKSNVIEGVGGSGIIMEPGSSAGRLSIDNNHIARIGEQAQSLSAAIAVQTAAQVEIASNTIDGVGVAGRRYSELDGIVVIASTSVRISDNDLVRI